MQDAAPRGPSPGPLPLIPNLGGRPAAADVTECVAGRDGAGSSGACLEFRRAASATLTTSLVIAVFRAPLSALAAGLLNRSRAAPRVRPSPSGQAASRSGRG